MGATWEARAIGDRVHSTRLCLLGVVRVERDDGWVELHGVQPRLVCAYLALYRGRLVPAQEIAQMLWPDMLSEHWEGAVRGVISKVRAFLHDGGPCAPTIDNVDHAYHFVLNGSRVDIDDAEHDLADAVCHCSEQRWDAAARAASATSLMLRETLLPGLNNIWIERFRAELLSMRCRACRVASVSHSRQGRHDEAIACAEAAVAEDGFDEQNHRALISAQLEAGNRGAALRAYGRCRRLLAEQLGVSPSDQTERLYLRVLAVDKPDPSWFGTSS
jgi:DNA-binding SARP family transcriptional activator